MPNHIALRRLVLERDGGVCDACKQSCAALEERIWERLRQKDVGAQRLEGLLRKLRLYVNAAHFELEKRSRLVALWHVDHIIPLVKGGLTELANLRTLCLPCHRVESIKLRQHLRVGKAIPFLPTGMSTDLGVEIDKAFSKFKGSTGQTYRDSIRRFFTALRIRSTRQARELTHQRAMQAIEEMVRHKYSAATISLSVAAATRLYRYWLAYGLVQAIPTETLDKPATDTRTMQENVLMPDEEIRLLAWVECDPRSHVVVLALLRQGWRVSELCKLCWKDVREIDGKQVAIFQGKGGRIARQVVKPEVYTAAVKWAGKGRSPECPFVAVDFRADVVRPLTRQLVYSMIRGYAKQLQLGHKITPHGLRATFISKTIAERGIEAARQLARHSNIGTTQRYSRFEIIE